MHTCVCACMRTCTHTVACIPPYRHVFCVSLVHARAHTHARTHTEAHIFSAWAPIFLSSSVGIPTEQGGNRYPEWWAREEASFCSVQFLKNAALCEVLLLSVASKGRAFGPPLGCTEQPEKDCGQAVLQRPTGKWGGLSFSILDRRPFLL